MQTIYIIKEGCLTLPESSQKVFLERLTVNLNLEGGQFHVRISLGQALWEEGMALVDPRKLSGIYSMQDARGTFRATGTLEGSGSGPRRLTCVLLGTWVLS